MGSMQVFDCAHQLARALRESKEYQNFLEIKEKIQSDKINSKMVKDFQIKNWEIQQAQMLQQGVTLEEQQELERLYSLLSLDPSARAYLEAEFKITTLLNDIQKIIGEAVIEALPIGFEELKQ